MKDKKKSIITLIVLVVIILAVCLGFIFLQKLSDTDKPDEETTAKVTTEAETTEKETEPETTAETEPPLADNPVDFKKLKEENTDIEAWIKVPNTKIDYPVVRHPTSEEFYLRRDYLGNYSVSGCIFIQNLNAADFSDSNTVVYGHYMWDGTFFGSLHNYRSTDYLKANPYFYIYTPGHILKYEIFAAYETDDSHILYSYDFSDPEAFEKYLGNAQRDLWGDKVTNQEIELNRDSKIVTLSTCLQNGDTNYRYIVQGVLIEDTKTE